MRKSGNSVNLKQKLGQRKAFMKSKLLLTALIALVLTSFANFAQAGGSTVTVQATPVVGPAHNPERIADAMLLGTPVVAYNGYFHYWRDFGDVLPRQRASGSWTMNLKGEITSLTLDDVQVPIVKGKPLKGLPINASGKATDYYANIRGVDASGNQVVFGDFQTRLLNTGDPINFTLLPGNVRTTKSYSPPAGVDPSKLRMETANGSSFGYDDYYGGFVAWLDSLLRNLDYSIVDTSTGEVLERGVIDPFGTPVVSTDSPVNFALAEGVLNIPVGETNTSVWLTGVMLTTSVERWEQNYPARVLYADMKGLGLALEVHNLAPRKGLVEVYEVTPDGERLVARAYSESDGNGNPFPTRIAIPEYLGKIRVVIVGETTEVVGEYGLWINANCFRPANGWVFGGGGPG